MRRSLDASLVGLAVVALVWGLALWRAGQDPCVSGHGECSWTGMQGFAHRVVPIVFLVACVWVLVALVRVVRAIDNRSS